MMKLTMLLNKIKRVLQALFQLGFNQPKCGFISNIKVFMGNEGIYDQRVMLIWDDMDWLRDMRCFVDGDNENH